MPTVNSYLFPFSAKPRTSTSVGRSQRDAGRFSTCGVPAPMVKHPEQTGVRRGYDWRGGEEARRRGGEEERRREGRGGEKGEEERRERRREGRGEEEERRRGREEERSFKWRRWRIFSRFLTPGLPRNPGVVFSCRRSQRMSASSACMCIQDLS
eukprot:767281-Hanusia_phi.AAC.4